MHARITPSMRSGAQRGVTAGVSTSPVAVASETMSKLSVAISTEMPARSGPTTRYKCAKGQYKDRGGRKAHRIRPRLQLMDFGRDAWQITIRRESVY